MSTIISIRDHECVPKPFFLYKCKIRRNMWANARAHEEQEYIFGIHFWPYYRKKIKPTKFANFAIFSVFYEFSGFLAKTVRPISSQRNHIDGWFFTTNTTFQVLQDRIPFGRFRDTWVFLWETPWNRPIAIITFFSINQEGVGQSFSSSNSTEISMRRFYAQNFITIGLALEELSC